MTDPAAVLRAAADLAEQRARAATTTTSRWSVDPLGDVFSGRYCVAGISDDRANAEHIAAADPAFMLKRAEEWRRAAELCEHYSFGEHYTWVGDLIAEVSLPSALAYLRQENQP